MATPLERMGLNSISERFPEKRAQLTRSGDAVVVQVAESVIVMVGESIGQAS